MRRPLYWLALTGALLSAAAACAQDAPSPDILSAIVPQLEPPPARTAIVFRSAAGAPADNACPMQNFDMVLTRNDVPGRTYAVMLDRQADPTKPTPKTFLAVVRRVEVDADGSPRAYHPEDPEGNGVCTIVTGRDGKPHPQGICAVDKLSSSRFALFSNAEKLSKDKLVGAWKEMWPLVRDRRLKPVDLKETFGARAPDHYYLFHWRARNLTAFFKRSIVPQDNRGYPCRHGKESPFAGYFVASTTLHHELPPRPDGCAPARYLDAEAVPFFVLPKGGFGGAGIGDVMVARIAEGGTERVVYGIVADAGPSYKFGEGSVALTAALKGKSGIVRSRQEAWSLDVEGPAVAVLVLGGTRQSVNGDYSRSNIEAVAKAQFAKWGGRNPMAQFNACVARAKVNRKCDAQRDKC